MKKIFVSIIAASAVLAVPVSASAADYHNNDRGGRYEQQYNKGKEQPGRYDQRSNPGKQQQGKYASQGYKHFKKGDRFDQRYARDYRKIDNPRAYGLRDAPKGQHWVRSGNDALLVGLVGGVIGAVIANAF